MSALVLIRHGECLWHNKNAFTGWMDVPLSSEGIIDAIKAGNRISGIKLDMVVTSMQIRAIETAMIALTQSDNDKMPILIPDDEKMTDWTQKNSRLMEEGIVPVFRNWHFNEQCELQKNNKVIEVKKPSDKCQMWCHSYDKPLQNVECLRDTADRTIPFFRENIIPLLEKGKNILISAHDSSLRPIIMYIENYSKEKAIGLEIPTTKPLCYDYKSGVLKSIKEFV